MVVVKDAGTYAALFVGICVGVPIVIYAGYRIYQKCPIFGQCKKQRRNSIIVPEEY